MIKLTDPSLYTNRELSWLRFNSRVLYESNKESNPLLEKLKFIAIYSTNLDEFYMIRVAGLKQLYLAGIAVSGVDKMTPFEQLGKINSYLREEKKQLEKNYEDIVKNLAENNLFIHEYSQTRKELQQEADEYFFKNIFPVIIPIAVDATHPFPRLNNLSFSLAVKLQDTEKPDDIKFAMVRIPRLLPRFIGLDGDTYITIESLVKEHIDSIFPGYRLAASAPFRVTRNADMVIEEEEADDFMEILEQGLKLRRKGAFVRMEIQKGVDEELLHFLNTHLNLDSNDIYEYKIPLNLGTLWSVVSNKKFSHLTLPQNTPKVLPPFNSNESIFKIIDKEDIMLFHPYESFDPVVKLIQTAAKDPKVLSIRMTLYRAGKNSPIVQALIDAANNGKQVTAIVELKARFDEENNLIWAKALEESGAHVIYGIPGFKVHAKITQIIRKSGDELKVYMHYATGNYNATTAKIYSDVSLFTSDDRFKEDSTTFFHILTGFSKHQKLKNLLMSPTQTKASLLQMIKREREKKTEGRIIAKMNSLVDADVIKALYTASIEGVKIDLIIRGICCLKPNVENVSQNIRVVSLVGKYLEHARVFYFKHSNPTIYISSADWMPRNLEKRLELMTPIYNQNIAQKLYDILKLQLSDTSLSWELQENGEYVKIPPTKDKPLINSQQFLENFYNKTYKTIQKNPTASKAAIMERKLFQES